MGFIGDIIKTVVDTGKKAIQDEVKEQTENAIESVSKKVTDTVSDAGDKFENSVKTSINGIGKGDSANNNAAMANSGVTNGQVTTYPSVDPTVQINSGYQNSVVNNTEAQGASQNINQVMSSNMNNLNSQSVQSSSEINSNVASKSIASDVANILEKKNLGNRDDLANGAGAFEKELTNKINEVTDAINTIYGKDTTQNDNVQDISGAFDQLLKASNNIGSSTDNELGKIINQAVQDNPGFQEGLAEMNKQSGEIVDKLQDGINNYKDLK